MVLKNFKKRKLFKKFGNWMEIYKKIQGGAVFVYFYDVKPKRKGDYGKLKRRFYYHFNKIRLSEFSFKTKSVFAVTDRYEKIIDSFFLGFRGEVEVYKVRTDGVEQLC